MSVTAFAVLVEGCTSLQPVDLPVAEVREQVRAGEITEPGERVSMVTEDGGTYEFEVVKVTDRSIQGDVTNVLIDDIVSVHIKQFYLLRTSLVAVAVVVIIGFYAAWDASINVVEDLFDL